MDIQSLLGDDAEALLTHESKGIPKDDLHLPGPDFVDRVFARQRPAAPGAAQPAVACSTTAASAAPATCRSCRSTRASSTRPRRRSRRTRSTSTRTNIVELAIEGGCNAVATTFGVLGIVSRAVRPPHPVHRQDQPQRAADATRTSSTRSCSARSSRRTTWARPASAPPSTSAPTSRRARSRRSARRSPRRTSSGMFTVLWCYLRNTAFKKDGVDYHVAADLTGQANHLGVTIEADIIKQKLPENNGGYNAFKGYGKTQQARLRRADDRPPDRPHALAGRELLHGPHRPDQQRRRVQGRERPRRGRATAVINKRAGGTASSPAARRSSARWPKASSCSTPSRTSTSTAVVTIA